MPVSTGDFVSSGSSMWDAYKDWLQQYEAPPFSLTPDEEKRLDEAIKFVTDNYEVYTKFRASFQNAYFDWQDLVLMAKDQRPSNYARLLAQAKTKMDDAKKDWNTLGKKELYDTQYARLQDLSQRDPVRIKQQLTDRLGEPIIAPGGDYYPTRIAPANLLDPTFKWPKFIFSFEERHEYSKDNTYNWGGSATVNSTLFSVSVDHSGRKEYHEQKLNLTKMSMSFELLRAPILRPWFSTYNLMGQAWKWRNSTRDNPSGGNPLSDGNLPALGSWQMIPTEAIFARNLSVKIDMQDKQNRESLLETSTSFQGGFGPFSVKGKVETKEGEKTFDFKETSDGIVCEQPQIIAYFCVLMPKSPNPNWALWEEAEKPVLA